MPTIGNVILTDNNESINHHDKDMFLVLALCGVGLLLLIAMSHLCRKSGLCSGHQKPTLVPSFDKHSAEKSVLTSVYINPASLNSPAAPQPLNDSKPALA